MPRNNFDQALQQLQDEVLMLGSMVQKATERSIEALRARDLRAARQIIADDAQINAKRYAIEDLCVDMIARQQPMARDLRKITAALILANELERMADYAQGISKINVMMGDEPLLKPLVDIPRMADLAVGMLHESLDAFVRRDAESARRLVRRDDEVDDLNRQVFRELLSYMIEDPSTITRALELVLVARNLERVADLATNVAEEVVFITEARIIKHHADESAAG
jgi:phosphate transport system protein